MLQRDDRLQTFLELTEEAITLRAGSCEGAQSAAYRIFTALRQHVGPKTEAAPETLPVCRSLDSALQVARKGPLPVPLLATALSELAPSLIWRRRKGAEMESETFFDGHANALVVGAEGFEARKDVMIGVSLMAPHVRYPDHRHPPEEVYVSLAGGLWWKEGQHWREPNPGGLIYNEPNVLHAMKTVEQPLLAIWCLML
jgi:quercetin dioxygenase-like cupin family protein